MRPSLGSVVKEAVLTRLFKLLERYKEGSEEK